MRIALIDSTPKPKVYPISLLKIGAWRKSEGDVCILFHDRLPAPNEFDEIWITTTFTFDIPHALELVVRAQKLAPIVRVGGISATLIPAHFERLGAFVHRGLLPEAECFAPDYSLLGYDPKYSVTHTSRGCIRKCKFCMVKTLEPKFENRSNWVLDLHPRARKILFYDNNWLAKDRESLFVDIESIKDLVNRKQITSIDFNQALDARLVDVEMADLIAGLPYKPLRFAFDGMHEDKHYQRAVRLMAERGQTYFVAYVLYNFKDTPQDFYYRLRVSAELSNELGILIASFPMRYQPILDMDNGRDFVGDHWTVRQKKNFMNILNKMGPNGIIATPPGAFIGPLNEFEFWFGKDENEFLQLLSYPKISELCHKKKGQLRLMRLKQK